MYVFIFVSSFKILYGFSSCFELSKRKKKIAEQYQTVIKLKVSILSKYILNYLK